MGGWRKEMSCPKDRYVVCKGRLACCFCASFRKQKGKQMSNNRGSRVAVVPVV